MSLYHSLGEFDPQIYLLGGCKEMQFALFKGKQALRSSYLTFFSESSNIFHLVVLCSVGTRVEFFS